MARSSQLWTIAELGALVARALAVDYAGQSNGQVRGVPDQRTIRYYTTLGLLDGPAEMRGRTALYQRRHLLQLVAIKRLQAAGKSLAEIQTQLLGLSPAALTALARVPADLGEAPPSDSAPAAPPRAAEPFWSAVPAPVAATPTLHTIPLRGDVALLLTTTAPLAGDSLAAIEQAAEPLLQLLEAHRLIRPRQERGTP
jgi:DNA-binding transcriptional MerR regulator